MVIAIYGRSHRCEGHGEYGSPCVAHPPPLNPAPISPPLSRRASWKPIMPPNRSEYQPLAQNADDEEADVSESLPQPVTARGLRRAHRPVHIDLRNLDTAFKRCVFRLLH